MFSKPLAGTLGLPHGHPFSSLRTYLQCCVPDFWQEMLSPSSLFVHLQDDIFHMQLGWPTALHHQGSPSSKAHWSEIPPPHQDSALLVTPHTADPITIASLGLLLCLMVLRVPEERHKNFNLALRRDELSMGL